MAFGGHIHSIVILSLILIFGIIHLGVGIGIVAKYHDYATVYQQQIGLSGYNIFIALLTIGMSSLGLFSVLNGYSRLSSIVAILAFILGIFAFASLITALALSSSSPGYLRDTITNSMNNYAADQDSIDIIDNIQTKYQCCGVNLWLDWGRVALGTSNSIGFGRRRRDSSLPSSPLIRSLRQKRQVVTTGTGVYNLPSSYTINLPLSCCKSGGTTIGNSLGGYCIFSANNGTSSFYVNGCLIPVASVAFSQITGIAVINTCLTILAFVCFAKLINLFPKDSDTSEKQPRENVINQAQQQQPQQQQYPYTVNGGYSTNNYPRSPYLNSAPPTYRTYL